ncbi:MAG: molybdopterin biosynthesis protein [Fervidicoccaceae archaeon]
MEQGRKLFHTLLSPEEALEAVRKEGLLSPLGTEIVKIEDSFNRVLAIDIYSPIDYPPFDRSEVDGYAVSARSVEGVDELHPVKLMLKGFQKIGEPAGTEVSEGEAVGIDTGAIIPRGASAVIMEEHTVSDGKTFVEVRRSAAPGENISFAGSDIAKGELIIPKGSMLTPEKIAVLSSLGISEVEVYKVPRISVLSTGNELVEPGSPLGEGKIYESNGRMVVSYLSSLGIRAYFAGFVPDDYDLMRRRIEKLLERSDIVITSGGTSAGEKDVVYRVFQDIGELVVHGLRMKPGKPTVIAKNGRKLLIGLPGFPLSALSNMILLVEPMIMEIMGASRRGVALRAAFSGKLRKGLGKIWILPVMLSRTDGSLYAVPVPYQSGSVSALMRTDAIAILPENIDVIDDGFPVNVFPLRVRGSPWKEALIVGSHDLLLQEIMRDMDLNERVGIAYVGSFRGLNLLKRGVIDVAPTHLLDPESRVYNIPFIEKDEELRDKAVLVKGYKRRLVLAYRKGEKIESLEDVIDRGLRFVNRNIGSGTRVYVDDVLEKIARERNISRWELSRMIKGYEYEVPNHNAVAAAIAQGRADAGICIEHAAYLYGLDYREVAEEHYDFAILKSSMSKEVVRMLIDFLKSDRLRKLVERYKGYSADELSGEVVCC